MEHLAHVEDMVESDYECSNRYFVLRNTLTEQVSAVALVVAQDTTAMQKRVAHFRL